MKEKKIKTGIRFVLGCIAIPFMLLSTVFLLLSASFRVITLCIIGEFFDIKQDFKEIISPYF
jgi:hypothetical protein